MTEEEYHEVIQHIHIEYEAEEGIEELSTDDMVNPRLLAQAYKEGRMHVTTDDKYREVARMVVMARGKDGQYNSRNVAAAFGVTTTSARAWIKHPRTQYYITTLQGGRDDTIKAIREDQDEIASNIELAWKRKTGLISNLDDAKLMQTSMQEMISMYDRTGHSKKGPDTVIKTEEKTVYADLGKKEEEILARLKEIDKQRAEIRGDNTNAEKAA
jgi:hypothetical protein